MIPDLVALLAVQREDSEVRALETKLHGLQPRIAELDRAKARAEQEIARTQATLEREESKHRELSARVTDHRSRQERNVAQLDSVRKMREATAAMAQVDMARRVLADEESELQTLARRLSELRSAIESQRAAVEMLDEEQAPVRDEIARERADLEERIAAFVAKREQEARAVSPPLLSKYDRISQRRRDVALFALRGQSCGSCDTAIPLQRRNAIAHGNSIDVCEACGVLLYAEG